MNKKASLNLNLVVTAVIVIVVLAVMGNIAKVYIFGGTKPIDIQFNILNETLNGVKGNSSSHLNSLSESFSEFLSSNDTCWIDHEHEISYWSVFTNLNDQGQQKAITRMNIKKQKLYSKKTNTAKTWCIITVRPEQEGVARELRPVSNATLLNINQINEESKTFEDEFEKALSDKKPVRSALDTQVVLKFNNKLCFIEYQLDNEYIFATSTANQIRNATYKAILPEGETCEI